MAAKQLSQGVSIGFAKHICQLPSGQLPAL